MGFTIPNYSVASVGDQAEPDSVDFQILGNTTTKVINGGEVTAEATNSQNVVVASFVVFTNSAYYVASSPTTISVGVGSANPRFDLIVVDSAGVVSVRTGTPSASNPTFPSLTANDVVLAAVYRSGSSGDTVSTADITDKRVFSSSNTTWLKTTAPSGSNGVDGDFWINTSASAATQSSLYVKRSGSWQNLSLYTATTSTNTASAIVARDASGNFSAGTITAALAGTASGNLVAGGALGTPSSGTLTNCTFPTLNQNTTGTAATATNAGNAATATALATARNIGGVPFNGTADINLPGVNTTGNQDTSGSSASCIGNSATATLAAKASTLSNGGSTGAAMTFNWSGQVGQPSWVWGSMDGVGPTNHYVYNPSNFSVATSSRATTTLGGAAYDVAITPNNQTGTWSNNSGSATYTMAFTLYSGQFWGNQLYPHINGVTKLGTAGNRWGEIWVSGSVFNGSDARLKTEITPSDLGLEFVNKLNPVSYKWIDGGYYPIDETDPEQIAQKHGLPKPGIRKHYGLIAQELKQALDDVGAEDFGGYVIDDMEDPDSLLSMRYEECISPIIKAIQELSAKIEVLEGLIND